MNILQLQSKTPPDLSTPREFRHQLEAAINLCVTSLTIRQRILLCVSEALTNLLIHGGPEVQNIKLNFGCDQNSWYLDIIDDGRPFDPNQQLDDNLLFTFTEEEHGRGIALLHSQSDELSYIQDKNTLSNHLRLRWSFPEPIKQKTILIVEDNNSLRFLYQSYLSKNFRVLTANNGYQALDSLQSNHIDLVISDIRMPQMNGLTLRKKINQQVNNQLIPFIFLTGEDAQLIQEQAAELGIDDYLIKPVNKSQLLLTIERVLSRSKQVYQKLSNHLDSKITASLTPSAPTNVNAWHFQLATRNTGCGGGDLLLHKHFAKNTLLLLTDIMGHDHSAKFFAHAYGGYMHGLIQAMQCEINPAQLLTQVSNCAHDDQLLSQITLTCCSALLTEDGKVSLASAGHPAPLLINNDGVCSLPSTGVLPGLLNDAQYENTLLQLKKGQRLAFYTDGLFESAADNNARNSLQQQIYDALYDTRNLSIKQSIQQVMGIFDRLTNGQPGDDSLLLLIEYQL